MGTALISLHSSPPLLCSRLSILPKTLTLNPKPFFSLRRHRHPLKRDLSVAAVDGDDGEGPEFAGSNFYEEEPEDTENEKDYEIEYDKLFMGMTGAEDGEDSVLSSGGFASPHRFKSETVVDYRINEEEFHKICLFDCDFFIRKPPDPDDNVYDFREMYFSPPDTDVYSIPTVLSPMPQKLIRCTKKTYQLYDDAELEEEEELQVEHARDPLYQIDERILKVFLTKHYRNRRTSDAEFMLDFEETYVIDAETRSITRAKITVVVPGGKKRDRRNDLLIIRDGGTSFKIIDQNERDDPQRVIEKEDWAESRDEMESYLRKFNDFEQSNWF